MAADDKQSHVKNALALLGVTAEAIKALNEPTTEPLAYFSGFCDLMRPRVASKVFFQNYEEVSQALALLLSHFSPPALWVNYIPATQSELLWETKGSKDDKLGPILVPFFQDLIESALGDGQPSATEAQDLLFNPAK